MKWKTVVGVLLIGLIIFASMTALQFDALNQVTSERDNLRSKYNQLLSWSNTTNNAINFLQQVVQIDTSHYQATLLSNTVEQRSDLGGALEQVMTYALTSSDSKMDVVSGLGTTSYHGIRLYCSRGRRFILSRSRLVFWMVRRGFLEGWHFTRALRTFQT